MDLLGKLMKNENLLPAEAEAAMEGMASGAFTPVQTAGLLVALSMKGETEEEIAAFAKVMRKHANAIKPKHGHLVDTCGTGGDSSHTFNVSTVAGIVAAGAGVAIAKHGNRSVSGVCGSADLLLQLGVKMMEPPQVEKCINEVGFGFMFAPYFHPAMKNVMPVRKELGVRTVFNILGPLSNPAGAHAQVLGVFDEKLLGKFARVLSMLGTKHALVVNSGGIDEIGLGRTKICELRGGKIENYEINASDFGFIENKIPVVKSKEEAVEVALSVLAGKEGAARDVAALNAAAAIYVGGKAESIKDGIALAEQSIDSGKAKDLLQKLRDFSNSSV